MAIEYPRAMAAYKVSAEAGDAACQYQLGCMYLDGDGVDVDYKQARPWLEKAAAQDWLDAVCQLGVMSQEDRGVASSLRRARELFQRSIELGNEQAVEGMRILNQSIQNV